MMSSQIKIIKLMNMLPLINRHKRQLFCSPLAGKMYKNRQPDEKPTISTISHATKSTDMGKLSSMKTDRKLKQVGSQFEPMSERSANRSLRGLTMFDTIESSGLDDTIQVRRKERSLAIIPYTYPQVEIIPLHLTKKIEDIKHTSLKISLQQCFKLYFLPEIDHTSRQLVDLLQAKIPKIRQLGMLDTSIQKQKWPSQFWRVNSTKSLLSLIKIYNKNSQYWDRYIIALLKRYCLPDKAVRTNCLQNLILLVKKELSNKLKIPFNCEPMVFILEDGKVVKDFIDIPLDVQTLYLTSHFNPEQTLSQFKMLVKTFKEDNRKKGLTGKIQNHFRREIVPNKYDEFSINYRSDLLEYQQERKFSINKALELLQRKKLQNRKPSFSKTFQQIERPKSKESVWRGQNVESSKVSERDNYFFHIDLGSKKREEEIKKDFNHYHYLSKQFYSNLGEKEILLQTIERYHPVFKQMSSVPFYSTKLKTIWEMLIGTEIPDTYTTTTISWRPFLQLWVLTSKNIDKLMDREDCYQLLRNFVEEYLDMKDEDYFRSQLSSKIFGMVEGDKEGVQIIEEVVWSWLEENGFVEKGAIQKQWLWTFKARSKTFYLLIGSIIFGTYKTTPLDLAYQLLI